MLRPDPAFDSKCAFYRAAAAPDAVRTVSIDEMTGIQALERIVSALPMRPGQIERRMRKI